MGQLMQSRYIISRTSNNAVCYHLFSSAITPLLFGLGSGESGQGLGSRESGQGLGSGESGQGLGSGEVQIHTKTVLLLYLLELLAATLYYTS